MDAVANGGSEHDDAPDYGILTANSRAALVPWQPQSGAYSETRPATLRMTNRSPGSASNMVCGSIRESEQAITAVVGR